jgi:hypothetical protein
LTNARDQHAPASAPKLSDSTTFDGRNLHSAPVWRGESMEQYENEVIEPAPDKAVADRDTFEAAGLTTNITSIFRSIKTISAKGEFQRNFGFDDPVIVNAKSQVSVSITEVNQDDVPFLAEADMVIWNVVPKDDGTISVRGKVDWHSSLRCRLNFIIVN